MGEPLSFNQEGIRLRGHAIECRINAEIPQKNFMPSPGVVKHLHLPAGNGVRVDTALYTGYRIPSDFQFQIMRNPEFCEGRADTGFIQRMLRLD